ncbi:DUF5064 family protein [Azotobacter bryophylli]|jgi:hypothetical protein|uniref:DUF5064 family protein n=1 Tax=Azotobacter bryophylli TaxID=1986537 RepID=A0ABV7AYG7_9GAMM
MFEPGHLHREIRADELSGQTFVYDLYYDVREDPEEGSMLHVRMTGTVDGKSFAEEFELHRDTAFNFFGVVTKLAVKHGLHPRGGPVLIGHEEYDRVFEDIRAKLGGTLGTPIDWEHLKRDDI